MVTNFREKSSVVWRWMAICLLAAAIAAPMPTAAQMTFSRIVVFGDSLSDPGNDFVLIKTQNTPPYDNIEIMDPLVIPHAPYAKGGHHYSNGATWVEQFARLRGMAQYVTPAWQSAGTKAANYAVGGGRARDAHDGNFNLPDQVEQFLADVGGRAPSDALYVIEFGGNDTRDILASNNLNIISEAAASIVANVGILYESGARKFLVWNIPDLSKTPAIRFMGAEQSVYGLLSYYFNPAIDSALSQLPPLPGIEIRRFDAFGKVNEIVINREAYGLEVVDEACVTPNVPPFNCKEPDEYLFWDGIHPTKAVHGVLAQAVAELLAQ